jgi:hypothetical protein
MRLNVEVTRRDLLRYTATDCWIEYDSGRFSFAGEPSPLKNSPLRVVRIE